MMTALSPGPMNARIAVKIAAVAPTVQMISAGS